MAIGVVGTHDVPLGALGECVGEVVICEVKVDGRAGTAAQAGLERRQKAGALLRARARTLS